MNPQTNVIPTYRKNIRQLIAHDVLMKRVVNQSPFAIFATDLKGVVTLSEGAAWHQFEVEPEHFVGTDIQDLPFGNSWKVACNRIIRGENTIRFLTPDWSNEQDKLAFTSIWIQSFSALRSSAGRIIGILGCAVSLSGTEVLDSMSSCPFSVCPSERK